MRRTGSDAAWRRRMVSVLLAVLGSVAGATCSPGQPAGVESAATLDRQRDMQARARAMCQDLVEGVLDHQLRSLQENGLSGLPVHAEIESLRDGMEALVEEEMQEVIDLLAAAEAADGADRDAAMQRVNRAVRRISMQLASEQRQVLRRLKIADIVAQARRLLREEETLIEVSDALPGKSEGDRESAALAALERQKTVRGLYAGLIETLEEVRGWEGAVGAGAAAGLRKLEEAGVAGGLDAAEERLGAVDAAAAAIAQRQVAAGIALLLEALETAQGSSSSSASATAAGAVAQTARSLAQQSQQLRDDTAKSALDDQAVESLADRQTQLRDELAKAAEAAQSAAARTLAEQARDAADKAAQKLFEGQRQEALAEQDKVSEALAELGEQAAGAGPPPEDAPRPREPQAAAPGPESNPSDPISRESASERHGDAQPQPLPDVEQESWFARLPAEARAAIRATSRRRPPRGYEERLDRYFKSVE